jgi:tRNA A37 threonylcarbamoyladenosine synthetase subunit TsaC/SUA5/YrdC
MAMGQNIPSTVLDLTDEPFQVVREGLGAIPF